MFFLPFIAIATLTAADQLVKLLAVELIKSKGSVEVIHGFFYLTYVENTGAAFGLMRGARWIFVAVTAIILIFGAVYYVKMPKTRHSVITRASLILICSGALGNFADRLFKGFVVDMFHFIFFGYSFAVFNFADILVVVGSTLLAFSLIFLSDNAVHKKED